MCRHRIEKGVHWNMRVLVCAQRHSALVMLLWAFPKVLVETAFHASVNEKAASRHWSRGRIPPIKVQRNSSRRETRARFPLGPLAEDSFDPFSNVIGFPLLCLSLLCNCSSVAKTKSSLDFRFFFLRPSALPLPSTSPREAL